MLVLSRKVGQRIVIGNNITITVVRLGGNRVHLGVEAPEELPVYRTEIYDKQRSAIKQAALQKKHS